ncbi:MAG: hypothetical protein HYZ58_11280 [Acidobacteria bacterium]|nr:hypothetical protein [Acidobacteriota bacterium]
MRRHWMVLIVIVGMLFLMGGSGNAQPKGEKVTLKGEVVDLWCYLEGGDRGPAKKACATACATAGNPIAILDAEGNLYVAAGLKDHQPGKDLLLKRMSSEVSVTGTLVKKGGVQMIYIDSVK